MADSPRSEAAVLEACRAGDVRAAAELVELHLQALHRVVGRLVGRWGAAEDIVQETFIRAFAHIDEIDAARGARPWLLRTAINLCRNYAAHTARRETPEILDEDSQPIFTGHTPDPEREAERADVSRKLEHALAQLSAPQREVVVLHYVEQLPFPEISRIVGTSVTGLKVRALRARTRLRALLEKDPS